MLKILLCAAVTDDVHVLTTALTVPVKSEIK